MKKEKRRIEILVDDRENGVLNGELEKLGVECRVERLLIGDYVYLGNKEEGYVEVYFERKTIDDFCESILDRRLERQVKRMKEMDENVFVLVSGNIKDRSSKINENCVLGKVVSLCVKHKVHVIFVENEKQMAYVIKNVVEKIVKERKMKGGDDDGEENREE